MKLFLLIICIFDVLSYKPPLHNSFSLKNSKFSNKRFPVKLDPIGEYRRAKFFETRKKIQFRKSFPDLKKKIQQNINFFVTYL